jgi:predicted component of type VI protein secretion system
MQNAQDGLAASSAPFPDGQAPNLPKRPNASNSPKFRRANPPSSGFHTTKTQSRTRHITPYPWGFSSLEIDLDLAQQSKFGVRRATGLMADGTPFDVPADSPTPLSIEVPDNAGGQLLWLTLPVASPDTREVDYRATDVASRFTEGAETFMDSTADLPSEQEIDVAYPRRAFQLGRTAKPGYLCLAMARIVEIRDKVIIFDQKFAPPLLSTTTSMPMRGMKWPPHLPLAQTCATRTQHERLSSRSQ